MRVIYMNKEFELLPILQNLQKEYGFIDTALIPDIAKQLNISKAEVYGVISFYHDFRTTKSGKKIVKICGQRLVRQ